MLIQARLWDAGVVHPSLAAALRLHFDRARENRYGLLSAAQLSRARRHNVDLAEAFPGPPVLCHGDLMSKNVLVSHDRGLLTIDPNPYTGPQVNDAA